MLTCIDDVVSHLVVLPLPANVTPECYGSVLGVTCTTAIAFAARSEVIGKRKAAQRQWDRAEPKQTAPHHKQRPYRPLVWDGNIEGSEASWPKEDPPRSTSPKVLSERRVDPVGRLRGNVSDEP